MCDVMSFPATVEEFMEQYKIVDRKEVYTNGAEMVPIFRMKQWFEHEDLGKAETNHPGIPDSWIPVSERLPSKEECKEWIDKHLGGVGYLYPCLVTRYSRANPDRTKNNPYVAKHYFDGEDFLNAGEEVCSEYIIAWMPLPKPYVR